MAKDHSLRNQHVSIMLVGGFHQLLDRAEFSVIGAADGITFTNSHGRFIGAVKGLHELINGDDCVTEQGVIDADGRFVGRHVLRADRIREVRHVETSFHGMPARGFTAKVRRHSCDHEMRRAEPL